MPKSHSIIEIPEMELKQINFIKIDEWLEKHRFFPIVTVERLMLYLFPCESALREICLPKENRAGAWVKFTTTLIHKTDCYELQACFVRGFSFWHIRTLALKKFKSTPSHIGEVKTTPLISQGHLNKCIENIKAKIQLFP